jgi:UDP-GlcNAc:undecaprenyl-phosphate GlcNAc-1-phosphate transferase
MLTMVWIVGLTNALNLLDNMDGLCAGIGFIAGSSLLGAFLLSSGPGPETTYLVLLLGALAGFLVYNVHPASIFMGDSGSLFIGLNLAVLTLGSPDVSHSRTNLISVLIGPVLVLLVPILDTGLVTVSRILSGRSAAQGGRDHASHRLVALGFSEREAVALLWGMASLSGILAVSIYWAQGGWAGTVAAGFILAMGIVAVYLARVRVYRHPDTAALESGRLTPFVADFMYKRRAAEVVLDVCLAALAYQAAYRLRFEGPLFDGYYDNFITSLPIVVGVQSIALYAVGAYRGVWRYFGLMDGVTFAKGVALGALGSVSVIVYLYRFEDYSRGVFVIYAALLMLMLSGSRASFRLFSEFTHRRRPGGRRLVIYGSGDSAANAVRTMLEADSARWRMLGFIDDDPMMARVRMQGYPVLGGHAVLMKLVADGEVDSVVITTPLIDVERLERLRRLCAERNVSLARLHVELSHLVAVS